MTWSTTECPRGAPCDDGVPEATGLEPDQSLIEMNILWVGLYDTTQLLKPLGRMNRCWKDGEARWAFCLFCF